MAMTPEKAALMSRFMQFSIMFESMAKNVNIDGNKYTAAQLHNIFTSASVIFGQAVDFWIEEEDMDKEEVAMRSQHASECLCQTIRNVEDHLQRKKESH